MNFKTTGLMLAALVAFVAAYVVLVPKTGDELMPIKPPAPSGSVAAQPVIEPPLGDITKIVAKVDGEEWVFEKSGEAGASASTWTMTKPLDLKVQGFDVDRIARQLTGLQYEVSLEPGGPGVVTAAQAGLEPAGTAVTLTDATGKSAIVEIGKSVSSGETYVRIPGQTRILIGNASLRNLLKPRAIEYRDPQLWNLAADKITTVEITDRFDAASPVEYRFVRDGARWNMESPVAARATAKVDELLQAVSRLRVTKWEDNRTERLAAYGLQPAALTVKVTVEEEVPVEVTADDAKEDDAPADDSREPVKTVKQTTAYELHVSTLSPVGEDTKTYVRVGEEAAVASIMKTMTEKLRPVMTEWRDMSLSQVNATTATRIEFNTPGQSATLVKKVDGWYFEAAPDQLKRADDEGTAALLQQLQNLKATAFVDGSMEVLAAANFNRPAADVKLTVPGVDGTERIVVGGFSDPQTKRLRYARRNDSKSIAKVKADDVAALLAGPGTLRDRTFLSLPVEVVNQLSFVVRNSCLDGNLAYTLSRGETGWSLIEPIKRPIRVDRVESFVNSLNGVIALAVVADEQELSAYGLHEPSITLTIGYGENDATESVSVIAAAHDGRHYAGRSDQTSIYEIDSATYQSLFTEFRPAEVLRFDAPQVKSFTVRQGAEAHTFERANTKWIYASEPDLPLDSKKVENLLLQVNDLKTEHVASFGQEDAADLGLTNPHILVAVDLEDGLKKELRISEKRCTDGSTPGHFAQTDYSPEVILLTPEMIDRIKVSLPALE